MTNRQFPTVGEYMTPAPHTIGGQQPLSRARQVMRQHDVRHLPVLDGGAVAGLLSERDVLMVEALPGVNPTELRVEEAMSETVFTAATITPLAEVVETMIERKLGSAVITEGEHVKGVFTTIDALRALRDMLQGSRS